MKAFLNLAMLHGLNSRALVECSFCLDIGHLSCYPITCRTLMITSVAAERRHAVPSQRTEPGISSANQFTVNTSHSGHRVWPHTKNFKEHVTDHMPMRTECIYISDFLKEYQLLLFWHANCIRPLVF